MKRSNDQQSDQNQQNNQQQSSGDELTHYYKRPRYSQPNYNDLYDYNNMMPQYNSYNQQQQQGYGSIYNMANYNNGVYAAAAYNNQNYMAYAQQQQQQQQPVMQQATQQQFNLPAVSGTGEASRTIYLGNITKATPPHDVLKCVRTGLVESYRLCPEKSCAFLAFLDPLSAQAFYQEYLTKKLVVNDQDIKIGWGKANTLNNQLKLQIQGGATRNVYLGRLTEKHTEEYIQATCVKFGPIEHVRLLGDKKIAFVHFLNISCAIKCVNSLLLSNDWKDQRVNYGKDHCAGYNHTGVPTEIGGFHGAAAFHPYYIAAAGGGGAGGGGNATAGGNQQAAPLDLYNIYQQAQAMQDASSGLLAPTHETQRTLYVGNIHPEAKTEDVCNAIRGGNLLQVRFLPQKHIAFVTFFNAQICDAVLKYAQENAIVIKGRKLRIGLGKPSAISLPISNAIQQGATRNIYIGGIPDTLTEAKIKSDFSQYGEIELVNTMREKKCAFVNFCLVADAVTAIAAMKLNPDYADYKLNFGKDRCGNPFKPMKKEKKGAAAAAASVKEEPKDPEKKEDGGENKDHDEKKDKAKSECAKEKSVKTELPEGAEKAAAPAAV